MLGVALFRSVRQHWLALTSLTFSRRVTRPQSQSWINQQELSKKLFPDKQNHCPIENLSLLKNWGCIVLMNLPQAVEIIWGNSFGVYDSPKSLWFQKYGKFDLYQDHFYSALIPTTCMHSAGVALCVSMGILLGRWGAFRLGFYTFFFCYCFAVDTELALRERHSQFII